MGEQFLFDNILLPIGLCLLLYASDYYLTVWGARLYAGGANHYMQLGGAYEPRLIVKRNGRPPAQINPPFLVGWMVSLVLIPIVRVVTGSIPFLFVAFSGSLILEELFVHFRHARNIASLWYLRRGQGATGKIEYEGWYSLSMLAVDALAFSLFCGLMAILLGSWFFAGGLLTCLSLAIRQALSANRLRRAKLKTP